MSNAISTKDVVMYFGHGGGEQYIRGHKISNVQSRATVLLMGCSSGKLLDGGDFDPWGTVLHYLISGSPCIVANLWDVTDKDLDRFSMALLKKWGLLGQESSLSLSEAVAESRDSCILKYLVGAAPVVYGIPTHISRT
jgi:separase